ncbi:hypothetical protein HanXRQr2_Chr14g0641431 [Helianthus annuus]|uniref:Uncharacterized protein n=1 Tax=Helianthus annuus TaxID=4232 RepID=A0A9K3E970_HELAN|nr:hypothetical protein HanXRQr2_Chr14g0641431 [Helianthus annuus]KAJ0840151.1 hypothetical protein HanPSC8_Chr14g0615251 [Helianthus annuus]
MAVLICCWSLVSFYKSVFVLICYDVLDFLGFDDDVLEDTDLVSFYKSVFVFICCWSLVSFYKSVFVLIYDVLDFLDFLGFDDEV